MALHLGAWARAGTVRHGCPLASVPQATGRACRWWYVETVETSVMCASPTGPSYECTDQGYPLMRA